MARIVLTAWAKSPSLVRSANFAMETLTSASANAAPSQMHGRTAEEEFCLSLPRHDPVAAQRLLCDALARLVSNREPDERQLGALLTWDQHSSQITTRLLLLYSTGDAQLRSLDRRFFISAQRLSQSFSHAYASFLGHFEKSADKSRLNSAGTVLIQLFRHRQVELLLRLFRYKKRNSEQWRQIHAAYQTALGLVMARDCPTRILSEAPSSPAQTLEQHYIHAILLGALNTGQFSPRELLWAYSWIARWRGLLTLQSVSGNDRAAGERNGFVVDVNSAEGPRRYCPGEIEDLLHLDTTPLMGAIDKEVAAMNDTAEAPNFPNSTEQDLHAALLPRLRIIFAPVPVQVKRRGDRKPVTFSVHAISGLPHIVQALREEMQRKTEQMAGSTAQLEEVTISPISGHTRMSTSVLGAGGLASFSIATTFGATPQAWQVKDHSDSGCRMRGQTADLNGLIPGALIAMRESESAQWTLAVVRRLRRLMVDHVEISVEHIGRKPRFVKIVTDYDLVPHANDASNNNRRCFGALYLPASEKHPTMPIKTLLVPATAFNAGTVITLLSSTASYSLRLNKPLEKQADFVWTSFTVIDKVIANAS